MTDWPRLYAIVDAQRAEAGGWHPPDLARAYLAGGARLLQLRAPGAPSGTVLAWTREVVEAAAPLGARVIVNDRADLARLSGAAGVHLGQEDLPVASARALLGDAALVGRSTHDASQVADALATSVDYVAIGPVFETGTKRTGYEPVGLEAVRRTRAQIGALPLVAIGGITLATAPEVIAAGATSVAVISDLLVGGDPAARVRQYIDILGDQ